MKNILSLFFIIMLIISFYAEYLSGAKQAEKSEEKRSEVVSVVRVKCGDNLEKLPHRGVQAVFRNENIRNEEGYGVYYENAVVRMSFPYEKGGYLQIHYDLPPLFDWGNWASIRREFESVIDMSRCKGVEFYVKVVGPSNAGLRLTLSDVVSVKDINKHDADEMWWYDFDPKLLAEKKGWVKVKAPFNGFYISGGGGTRHNDGHLDRSKIIAYELNVISKGGEHPRGVFGVKNIRTY